MAALVQIMAWQQAIIWTNVGMLYGCIYVSLGLNELRPANSNKIWINVYFFGSGDVVFKTYPKQYVMLDKYRKKKKCKKRVNSPGMALVLISRTGFIWGRDKMAAISQTTLSSAFSWQKMSEFRLKFHWTLFRRVQLTIFQHCFR